MNASRRYEILLPLKFNDGESVPESYLVDSISELERNFQTQVMRGDSHDHKFTRVFLNVPDTVGNREFFLQLKQKLKVKFQQSDIWLTSYSIEIL